MEKQEIKEVLETLVLPFMENHPPRGCGYRHFKSVKQAIKDIINSIKAEEELAEAKELYNAIKRYTKNEKEAVEATRKLVLTFKIK